MRTILVLNSKGGCGKSTLARNLAAHYALAGRPVVLGDCDPQASSMEWLEARPASCTPIRGVAAFREPLRVPRDTEYLVLDAPAAVHGPALTALVRRAQTILIPVLPSATDIRAAAHFVHELLLVGKVSRKETRLATVANRVPEAPLLANAAERTLNGLDIPYATLATRIYRPLERFLGQLQIPFVATLRDSPSYLLADAQGLSIFELAGSRAMVDQAHWRPLLDWLDSRRSVPRNP